jgi:predicted nucleic acid-binding protein
VGLTVLDAGVLIAILDANDAHHASSRGALSTALRGGAEFVLPASAYAEALVAPYRRSTEAASAVDRLVDALPATVQPATREIARKAAELRARYGNRLRLPDALTVATAIELGAERVLTTDARWPVLPLLLEVIAPIPE